MKKLAVAALAALISTTAAKAEGFDEALTRPCALLYNNISYPRMGQLVGPEEIAKVMRLRGQHATDTEVGNVLMGWLYDGKVTGEALFGSILESIDIAKTKPECVSSLDQEVLSANRKDMADLLEQMGPMLKAIARPAAPTTN